MTTPPPTQPTYLGIDPSSTCAGWAVLRDDGSPDGAIVEKGTIRLSTTGLERWVELAGNVREVMDIAGSLALVIVERPEDSKIGKARQNFGKRGHGDMATFGTGVGIILAEVLRRWPAERVRTPSPMEWVGRGRIPSSRNDAKKVKRVRWAEKVWGLNEGDLGSATTAGNVADALYLSRWGMWTARMDRGLVERRTAV